MTNQDVLFYVFTGFFVLIGLGSMGVLLGVIKAPDERFRTWAVRGFVAGVTTAMFGLFKVFFTTAMAPIVVTLVPPPDMSAPLKSGIFEYDESAANQAPVTRKGSISPVLTEGGWEVSLPGEVSTRPTRLHLQDEDGSWWDAGPFFPNRVRQSMRTGKPFAALQSDTSWQLPGVALLSAAEPGREPAAAQEQSTLKFNNYARKVGDRYDRPYYDWRVFVDEPPAVLATVTQVDYVLHPTFPEPFQTARDRNSNFEVKASGWGGFTILVTVHYTNGKEAKASYFLDLNKSWPAEAAVATVAPMQVRLDKIQVKSDGSVGSTGWVFDILFDGKPVLSLPKKDYDDGTERTKKASEYVPDANRRVVGAVKVARNQAVHLEVRGKRTFGGDTATGEALVGASAGQVAISVTNKKNPKNGSFVFLFAAVPM